MIQIRTIGCLAGALIVGGFSPLALAQTIPPASITYTVGANEIYPNAPDSTGHILADGVTSTVAPAFAGGSNDEYVEFAPSAFNNPVNAATLQFNLGSSFNLSSLSVAYYKDTGAGLPDPSTLELSYSTDGQTFTAPIQFTFPQGTDEYTVQSPNFTLNGIAQYVDVEVDIPDGDFAYLSEFGFTGTPAPEPASASVLLLGVGALVARARTRKA